MLVEEPTPTLPTSSSCLNRSSMFCTGAAAVTRADPAGKRRPAEPVVAARIGLDVRKLHHRLARQVARDRAEHGAVARRTHIDVIRRRQRRRLRHVLHHDGRLAGQLLGQIFRQQPRADVVVVADLVADHERELAALVELRRALRLRAARQKPITKAASDNQTANAGIPRSRLIPPPASAPARRPPCRSSPRAPADPSARPDRSNRRAG